MEATLNAPITNAVLSESVSDKLTLAQGRDVQTRKRSRTPKAQGESMPKPSGQPAANVEALSTPESIDYGAIVARIAQVKAPIGTRFVGNKQKSSIKALVFDHVRSALSIPKWEDEAKKLVNRLPEDIEKAICHAISEYWLMHARKIVDYGEVVSVSYDTPRAFIVDGDKGKDVDLQWNATLKAKRQSKDDAEFRLGLSFAIRKAHDRLEFMRANPSKYDGVEIRAQHDLITRFEGKLLAMEKERDARVASVQK